MAVETGSLHSLLQKGVVWQAYRQPSDKAVSLSTGYPELDQALPGSGWQRGQLVELLYRREGGGELRLLLPALAQLCREGADEREPGWLLWVDPPHIPYAPALAEAGVDLARVLVVRSNSRRDRLWCLEQALKSGCCSAVLGWLPTGQEKAIRRLQVAAVEGGAAGFLFRPAGCREQSSAAPCRLLLQNRASGAEVTILKRRGGWALPAMHLLLGEERILPAIHQERPELRLVD
ncbi:translesion DNA synthesis-associated protein ImuA [Marinobacterium arenosum]|uniref:translesion DNA synthesis-associated protein ImuA n=1 Tax=Marinobacterium arenosum TaxID=2862496 RepID=UPI001C980F81|nr:translesion DNA synthesis-associated protein ImuA [Marinobacterium arenosum]MBY4675910.1 translesion DNA synthesis-associated protein ImuA [Marinobacterium arenosum]